jgi:uroporphyrinogen decarboxylase
MKMNMERWIEQVIQQKKVAAVPIMTHPGIELGNRTVREAVTNGQIHYEAVMRLCERYPSAAACTIMDLTTEAECFGAEIEFSDIAVPAVRGRLLNDIKDISRLKVPSLNNGRIPEYLKANLLAAEKICDRPLFGGCIGPFSLAGRLYDMSDIMVLICEEPDAAHELLSKCTEFILKYCLALRETGANGVVMAEPAAGLMSNEQCVDFSSLYVKYIVEKVQTPEFSVVLHNCGNTGHCTKAMVETGAAMYHFGNKCAMCEVMEDVPPTALGMGNIDPVSIFKDAMPAQMKQTVKNLLEQTRRFPNFVLSSGCDTPPHTPLHNIDAFFEALLEWNE